MPKIGLPVSLTSSNWNTGPTIAIGGGYAEKMLAGPGAHLPPLIKAKSPKICM
jgi:hypothetical protein